MPIQNEKYNISIINMETHPNLKSISELVQLKIGDILDFKKMSGGSNEIFYIKTNHGEFIVKIYNEDSSQRTNLSREIQMSSILKDFPEIRSLVFSDTTRSQIPYEFAIFEYVDGQTLRFLVENNLLTDEQLEVIADQIFDLIKRIIEIATKKFGQLDESGLIGTSQSWVDFLGGMQDPTTKTFENSNLFPDKEYLIPQAVLDKHKSVFELDDPRLIPMDLNIDNIIVTPDQKIKFIDPETFWSGDPLCAFAQFYALTKGTILGDKFFGNLELSPDDEFKVRLYALLDNLNVLAFITRVNPEGAKEAKPYGNPNKFFDLINENVKFFEQSL